MHTATAFFGRSSNFIVKIGGRLIVNELVGVYWNQMPVNKQLFGDLFHGFEVFGQCQYGIASSAIVEQRSKLGQR